MPDMESTPQTAVDTSARVVRVEEAARMLGMSRSQAYAMIKSGELKTVRWGRSVRVKISTIDRLLDEREGQ